VLEKNRTQKGMFGETGHILSNYIKETDSTIVLTSLFLPKKLSLSSVLLADMICVSLLTVSLIWPVPFTVDRTNEYREEVTVAK
jgi:hypothetical protein